MNDYNDLRIDAPMEDLLLGLAEAINAGDDDSAIIFEAALCASVKGEGADGARTIGDMFGQDRADSLAWAAVTMYELAGIQEMLGLANDEYVRAILHTANMLAMTWTALAGREGMSITKIGRPRGTVSGNRTVREVLQGHKQEEQG